MQEQNNNIDKTYQLKHSGRVIRSIKSCKFKIIKQKMLSNKNSFLISTT